jgi:hypothetical protein
MWGLNVMLESGAVYRNLPPHAVAFKQAPEPEWAEKDAQTWDCYGEGWSGLIYPYLDGLDCLARTRSNKVLQGRYLMTTVPIGDSFSAYPEQQKEFTFIELENGRLTIQPTNYVVFQDRSFNTSFKFPVGLKRQTQYWSCE